jgi:hypothetical protein
VVAEPKSASQLAEACLAQVGKYENGLIVTRLDHPGEIAGVPTLPLPVFLFRLGPSPVTAPDRL